MSRSFSRKALWAEGLVHAKVQRWAKLMRLCISEGRVLGAAGGAQQ